MGKKPKAKPKPVTHSLLPECDSDDADGRPVDSGMRHTQLTVVRSGLYVDAVQCARCKREFNVAAKS